MNQDPKYPHITVSLTGKDGNAFLILGTITKALKHNNIPKDERDAFMNEATSGDYDHLLQTAMKWVTVA